MLRVAAVLCALVILVSGCFGNGSASNGGATATPEDPRPYLYRIHTLEKLYEVGVAGRIPLGFLNEVQIDKANARLTVVYHSVAAPTHVLRLSAVMAASRDDFMSGGHRYEWQFVRADETDEPLIVGEREVFWTVSLRFESGALVMYEDDGSGPREVERGQIVVGDYELSATVPLTTAHPAAANDYIYFRSLVYADDPRRPPFDGVGDIFPRDLTWRRVLQY